MATRDLENLIDISQTESCLDVAPFAKEETEFARVLPYFLSTYRSEHTRMAYQKSLESFFSFCAENHLPLVRLTDLQRFHINAWQRRLENSHFSLASISAKISAVISFGRFLFEHEWVEKNPGEFIQLPKISKQKGKTEALSEEEIRGILEMLNQDKEKAYSPATNVSDHRAWLYYGIFLTMATVGMRCSEFVNLKKSDVQKTSRHYRLRIRLKGGEDHTPLIPDYLAEFLFSYLTSCRPFCSEEDPLFAIHPRSKDPLRREVVSEIIAKVAKRFGIDRKISAHSLRATVASMLHKNKVPVGEIKDLLGHKSIVTTMMYVRKTNEEEESAALKNPLKKIFE